MLTSFEGEKKDSGLLHSMTEEDNQCTWSLELLYGPGYASLVQQFHCGVNLHSNPSAKRSNSVTKAKVFLEKDVFSMHLDPTSKWPS